jgi:hypothetical protein
MRVRGAGLVVALALTAAALVGVGIGYALGLDRHATPVSFAASPVPASSPSYPVIPAVVLPDDPYPALAPGLPTHLVRVGSAPFQVRVPIPRGWIRSDAAAAEWRWYPARDRMVNLYFARVSQVANTHQPVPAALAGRIAALRAADDVDEFDLESQDEDSFVATYVSGGHRRVSYEGYLPRDGTAYVRIAVIGREADRAGLADLFDELMAGTEV